VSSNIIFIRYRNITKDFTSDLNLEQRNLIKRALRKNMWWYLFFAGLWVKKTKLDCKQIYQKYFGDNYEFEYDNGYSLIICNHSNWSVRFLN
jgi:hypothetical protein